MAVDKTRFFPKNEISPRSVVSSENVKLSDQTVIGIVYLYTDGTKRLKLQSSTIPAAAQTISNISSVYHPSDAFYSVGMDGGTSTRFFLFSGNGTLTIYAGGHVGMYGNLWYM
jgi:hypothetical protein